MSRSWIESSAWMVLIATDVMFLLAASGAAGFLATIALAAAWCARIDREEHAGQVLTPDVRTQV